MGHKSQPLIHLSKSRCLSQFWLSQVLGCCIDDIPEAQRHVVQGATHSRAGPSEAGPCFPVEHGRFTLGERVLMVI